LTALEDFKIHFEKTHRNETKKFSCNLCEKKFSWSQTLKIHIQTIHQDDREFQCDHCALTFRLKNHLRKHLNEKHTTHAKSSNAKSAK
jgi:DNA-directed RNA polymerase subunit RPC12/RpoP